jgi:LAO/AO transport system kinase
MEIADVFAVNKADRDGVERVVAEVESMLSLAPAGAPRPAVVKTVATRDEGTGPLLDAVEAYRARAAESGVLEERRRARLRRQLEDAVRERVMGHVFRRVAPPAELEATVARLAARSVDPFTAADEIVERMGLP